MLQEAYSACRKPSVVSHAKLLRFRYRPGLKPAQRFAVQADKNRVTAHQGASMATDYSSLGIDFYI